MSSKISKGGKEARLKEGGGGGGKAGKSGGLTDVFCHLQIPRHYGTFPWASRKGRTGTRPYQKPDQKSRVLCQEEVISLQSSAQAEALRPDSCVQDWGTRKTGRIGRAKERKERGQGREVNKVSCSLPVGALWPVVRVRRRPGTKGSQLRPLGLVHWQASWPLSTPSGQDVSLSKEDVPPESPFVAGRVTPSRARN